MARHEVARRVYAGKGMAPAEGRARAAGAYRREQAAAMKQRHAKRQRAVCSEAPVMRSGVRGAAYRQPLKCGVECARQVYVAGSGRVC